jgi:hypothetical protein
LIDRRLSAKLMPTFADRGCHVVGVTDLYGRIRGSLGEESIYFRHLSIRTAFVLKQFNRDYQSLNF